ncbi:MAG: DNA primase [Burkholderiaceae bacterium]
MIPQSFIQDLLARVDIVDVVGRHVKLKKGGANFLGLCPFHGEKSPSFTVSPSKQFYHCFGCGAHGSAIGFLMEHGGLGYVDAVHELARSVGVDVPQEGPPGAAPDRRAPALLELLAAAAKFYRQRLKDSPAAIDYLKRRGLTGETAARFGIGYAPDQWRGLEAAVADYDLDEMVAAGLVIDSEGDDGRRKRYDRFRDRIMFPIRNPRGQVIGFGGRVLDRGEPKYLNSPETPVFSKGRELYGAYEARDAIRAEDCVLVVEGYMDVVMLAQHGVANAVATLGTATTPDHVRKLLRLVDRVVFAFDGDAAGRKAAWRALEASLPHAADTKRIDFLFLPAEHDPDSFVRAHGADGFREALAGALPLSELLLRGLSERVDLNTSEGRARLLAEARPLLQALGAPALRMQLGHRLAELAGVSAGEAEQYLSTPDPRASAWRGGRDDERGGDGYGAGRERFGQGPRGGAGRGPEGGSGRAGPAAAVDGVGAAPPWAGDPQPGGAGAFGDGGAGGFGGTGGYGGGGSYGGGRFGGPGGSAGPGGFAGSSKGFGQGGGRRGDRRFGGAWAQRPAFVPRVPVGKPDLEGRVRLLAALHPGLAVVDNDGWLPEPLSAWLAAIAALPPGSALASVCEVLRAQWPDAVTAVERVAASEQSAVSALSFDEAQAEMQGALAQLRERHIGRLIDEIVAAGLNTPEERERYQELMAMKRRP